MNQSGPLGLRVSTDFSRVERSLVERARKIPVAVLGDVCQRLRAFPAGFTPYGGRKRFAGPAITVKVRPGDNLFVHKALDEARPGDVVVVDAGGGLQTAIVGALMTLYAHRRGIEALVIDGAIRDVEELAKLELAVVARGATPNGPFKSGPGEIGVPVACGGLVVNPGDLVAGDADGVLVLPADGLGGVIAQAEEKHRAEQLWEREILEDRWDRRWVQDALERL